MPNDNRISATLTEADMTAFMAANEAIRDLIPFSVNLTMDERISTPKFGPASMAFDEHCKNYMTTHPQFVPPYLDPAEVNKDRDLRLQLANMRRELKSTLERVDDTLMVVGGEIWMADLTYYQTVRQAARRDVDGADTVYSDLRARFPGAGGDPVPPPEEDEDEDPPVTP